MKPKKKTKNNLCSRDCDPAFSFFIKNKNSLYYKMFMAQAENYAE